MTRSRSKGRASSMRQAGNAGRAKLRKGFSTVVRSVQGAFAPRPRRKTKPGRRRR